MLDEYHVLWRALRHPMVRWWRKTGAWWMAAMLLLVVNDIAIAGLILPRLCLNPGQPGALAGFMGYGLQIWGEVRTVLLTLVKLTAILTILSAASACNHFAAQLVKDFPDPGAVSRHGALFLCALRQAVWPLAVVALLKSNLIDGWLMGYLYGQELTPGWKPVFVLMQIPQSIPWGTAVFTIWLIALITVLGKRPWLAWAWAICAYAGQIGYMLIVAIGMNTPVPATDLLYRPTLSSDHLHFGWLTGAALTVLIIRLALIHQRGWVYMLGVVLMLSAVLSNAQIVFPSMALPGNSLMFTEIVGPYQRAALFWAYETFTEASNFTGTELAWYDVHSRTDKLHPAPSDYGAFLSSAAPVYWSVEVPSWVQYPLMAVNAAYLAMVIWFIAGVLLRQRAGSATFV